MCNFSKDTHLKINNLLIFINKAFSQRPRKK